jgi:hypothetical protein
MSMADEITDDELKALHRAVQEAALKAYPNPERKGCPGTQVLQQMARLRVPPEHKAYSHVQTCSPCLRELLDLQKAKSQEQRSFKNRALLAACFALFLVGAIFLQWRTRQNLPMPSAVINFSTTSVDRGSEPEGKPKQELQSFQRKSLLLTVYLVPGSDDGAYDFQVLSPADGRVLENVSGTASISQGLTSLICKVDFSRLNPGMYKARVKRRSSVEWRSLTVELK